ncbi:RNA polymerase sigma factor [Polaribacter uvawellassae]|uniref:RNA polymerase sigma factor n=1 Tax=Polaribacter uvawellassae TaxID=3133495 RepID=UPI00321B363C
MNKHQLVALLKNADKKTLSSFYIDNRAAFINFAKKFHISDDDILDVYQDAIIAIQEKAIQGKMDSLTCSVKTYLFGIGKYMLYEKARKNNKKVVDFPIEKEGYNFKAISDVFIKDDEKTELQISLEKGFETLGKKCKEVLTLFYYRGFTIDEIAKKLNYNNKNVVKSQKSRCIKQLKENINL